MWQPEAQSAAALRLHVTVLLATGTGTELIIEPVWRTIVALRSQKAFTGTSISGAFLFCTKQQRSNCFSHTFKLPTHRTYMIHHTTCLAVHQSIIANQRSGFLVQSVAVLRSSGHKQGEQNTSVQSTRRMNCRLRLGVRYRFLQKFHYPSQYLPVPTYLLSTRMLLLVTYQRIE